MSLDLQHLSLLLNMQIIKCIIISKAIVCQNLDCLSTLYFYSSLVSISATSSSNKSWTGSFLSYNFGVQHSRLINNISTLLFVQHGECIVSRLFLIDVFIKQLNYPGLNENWSYNSQIFIETLVCVSHTSSHKWSVKTCWHHVKTHQRGPRVYIRVRRADNSPPEFLDLPAASASPTGLAICSKHVEAMLMLGQLFFAHAGPLLPLPHTTESSTI